MKIKPRLEGHCVPVPVEPVIKMLGEVNGTKLKVLLYLLANPSFEPDEVAEKLDITKKALISAVEYWQTQGVFEKQEETSPAKSVKASTDVKKTENVTVRRPKAVMSAPALPRYTSDEVAAYIENHEGMHKLLGSCQQYMGKMFNASEVETVVGLMDYLKLDEAYVLLLFSYCDRINKRSIRYIEKLAVELFDKGIMSYDELDTYLMVLEASKKMDKPLRELFGIGRRALTAKEKDIFESWMKWEMPMDVIEKAYEVTVENTGGASIPYCNAVLSSWNDKGYKTVDEVTAGIEQYKHDKEGAKDKKGSFDTDDFFEAALRRSYGDTENK